MTLRRNYEDPWAVLMGDEPPLVEEPERKNVRRHRESKLRRFVAWDGEGISYTPGQAQSYVLFGNSDGQRICSTDLGTVECLELLLSAKRDAIHIGFALGYDFNMILKDLPHRSLWRLYRTGEIRWSGYIIKRVPGKWLHVRKPKSGKPGVKLFDVFGYFQSSFVKACEEYLGKDNPELVRIREGKLRRKEFAYEELQTEIVPYWEAELRLMVRLMDALREDFTNAGIKISSWHGPGAVATSVFKSYGIQVHKAESRPEVLEASRYAYAGGRFELFQCGHYPHAVWEYDINSAYPAAIAELPNLSKGCWEHVGEFEPGSFGIWRINFQSGEGFRAQLYQPKPLFYRDKHGGVSFPSISNGWYWTPEAELVKDSVQDGWVLRHDESKPFGFVHDMYETRRQWKKEGNSAQRALKLALNSLYGKMAQRSGWKPGEAIPPWHQLEWAGFVTSSVRAKLWNAISINPQSVIAVETDAIFSTQKLNLPIGEELGSWEATEFDWITYVQSGFYYAGQNGTTIEKYRGFDKGSVPHDAILSYMSELDSAFELHRVPPMVGLTTRFIGMGLGLRTKAVWRSWQTEERRVMLGGGGKRLHHSRLCSACKQGKPFVGSLHPLMIGTVGGDSFPHNLPWLDEDSELRKLEEIYYRD